MPICANAVQTADGLVLVIDTVNTNLSTCSYTVSTGAESVLGALLDLTPDQALIISTEIAVIWAVCWGIVQVRRAISFGDSNHEIEN